MKVVVFKFGGTSVADVPQIKKIALKVKNEVNQGNRVIVVVSAMAGVTNNLIDLVKTTSEIPSFTEYDVVLSTGEQVTSALLASALNNLNIKARSWLIWQVPIISDKSHAKALIEEIRGGADTSGVAIAAAFSAERCDIYTDVDGVYTTDPRIVKSAKKLDLITYEEMLELASQGAKVLQTRSVALAMKYNVKLRVLSSFEDLPGTSIIKEEENMEKTEISGIAHSLNEAKITLSGCSRPTRPGSRNFWCSGKTFN